MMPRLKELYIKEIQPKLKVSIWLLKIFTWGQKIRRCT